MDIKEIFKDNGILKKKNKNYKKRVSQIKAAILLEKAIKDKKHFILEGPCGFGKSISYLIPSIKNLIESFKLLSGVGEKTAERFAFSILGMDEDNVEFFSDSL